MQALDLDLVPQLASAIDDGQLVLHYQPEVDLATGAVLGMEALVRWQHPQRGLLWPGEFLPIAEAAGLLPLLGWWVFERCLEQVATWSTLPPPSFDYPRRMWVNVGGAQLVEPGFAEHIASLVSAAGIPPGVLGIEVTEQALDGGLEDPAASLTLLREAGVALAVDDFGTWYSTLATLGELPVDAVKLDRTFVRGVGSDLEGDDIVASVIRLAHAHGLVVVAEGVESWAEGAKLCDLGCDRALGYLFSGPQPADRARLMLARGTGWRRSKSDLVVDHGIGAPRTGHELSAH